MTTDLCLADENIRQPIELTELFVNDFVLTRLAMFQVVMKNQFVNLHTVCVKFIACETCEVSQHNDVC